MISVNCFTIILQVFKEEEESIKVDLHEGCGRMKLFWLMALADAKTLKAMVEFREGNKGNWEIITRDSNCGRRIGHGGREE